MDTTQKRTPYKHLTYKKDARNGSILSPEIYLCNRNLQKTGRLYPVESPNLIVNFNAADEISFSYYKEADGNPCAFYNELQDLSVIKVEMGDHDNRYFEISVSETDNGSLVKNISGKSLGHCELSQRLVTLEINTESDIQRTDYQAPTILYDEDDPQCSLLHRLLTYAPDYEIGEVDETIAVLQRTFSWSNSYMDSCLNEICQELDCIYTIDVFFDHETQKPVRRINFYDVCYCIDCWNQLNTSTETQKHYTRDFWKNVSNGECMECGGTNIAECGKDTTITVNTKNLTDQIQITTDKDQIKNCFSLKAGDEYMTNIIQGINPSGSNKIMLFSEEQMNQMSPSLREKWNRYLELGNNPDLVAKHESLIQLNFNILDLILYAESGKMPVFETGTGTIEDQYNDIVAGLKTYENKFYTSSLASYQKATGARTAITNLISTFLRKGYSLMVNATDSVSDDQENNSFYYWYGSYKVYKTDEKDICFTVTVSENGINTVISYGNEGKQITHSISGKYKIVYGDKDIENYKLYLEQQLNGILAESEMNQCLPADWKSYCINRLDSFSNAYQNCIDTLDIMSVADSAFQEERDKQIARLKTNYQTYIKDITAIKNVLNDQLFCLYYILGSEERLKEKYPSLNNAQDYSYKMKYFSGIAEAASTLDEGVPISLHSYDSEGNPAGTQQISVGICRNGNRAVQCLHCGSTNMLYDSTEQLWYCGNKLCGDTKGSSVVSYVDYCADVCTWVNENPGKTITGELDSIHEFMDPEHFFGTDLFRELSTFLREDIYENNNYLSENLACNAELIANAREFTHQAKRELAKACMPQISISCDIANLVVQEDVKPQNLSIENAYQEFTPGNFIRVIADDTVYRLRVISITYPFSSLDKVQVTFSNITRTLTGSASDVESILSQASSMASSFQTVATQAQKGEIAAQTFDTIKKEGLDSSLAAIKAATDQSILIDDTGFTCRHFNRELNEYDDKQLKIINSNISLTEDGWNTSKLAIGLGNYQGKPKYGIWADLLVGDLIAGKELVIQNNTEKGNASVIIDENGITLDGGSITWKNPLPISELKNDSGYQTASQVTQITKNTITTQYVNALGIKAGSVDAENIQGTTIKGKTFSGGNINIGNGNFVVNSSGQLTAKGGIYFENDLTSWNGSSCFKNSQDEFLIQQMIGQTPVVKLKINEAETYMIGNQVRIAGAPLILGSLTEEGSIWYTLTLQDNKATFGGEADFKYTAYFSNISIKAPDGVPLECLRVLNYTDNSIRTVLGNYQTVLFLDAPSIWASTAISVTSDARSKEDFSSLDGYENFFMDLEPCSFKYIDGTSNRKHIGFTAQQVKTSLDKNDLTTQDFAGYVNSTNDENGELSLRYSEFIALNTHMIQKLYQRVEKLEQILKEKGIDINE